MERPGRDVGNEPRGRVLVCTLWLLFAWAHFLGAQGPGADPPWLGDPPELVDSTDFVATTLEPSASASTVVVDPFNREAVVALYHDVYVPALAVPMDWTGDITTCDPGATSVAYADATIQLVNYFRAMAGLPGTVTGNPTQDVKAQEAALMMAAEGDLDHSPPTTWACYSAAGDEAAGQSNLSLGHAGPAAVVGQVGDNGANNAFVGHRRWILYPPETRMGAGSVSGGRSAMALSVFGDNNSGPRPSTPEFVAWPNAGFVPYQVLPTPAFYNSNGPRWSFSLNRAKQNEVDFSSATVTMTEGGASMGLSVQPVINGGFGDRTLVWEPDGLTVGNDMVDQAITVTVDSVLVDGASTSYIYTVTIIDPDTTPSAVFTDDPLVPGTDFVKAVHITELRVRIDALRVLHDLVEFSWTDATLTAGVTEVKAAHFTEMRTALSAAYDAAGRTPPTYATPIAAGSVISAAHITEVRVHVLALE